jgi:Methyltransferase domain
MNNLANPAATERMTPTLANWISDGLMPDPAGLSVWDLGCGDGRFSAAFVEMRAAKVMASDLHIPFTGASSSLRHHPTIQWLVGGFDAATQEWGNPVPADLVFMCLMSEHVSEPRTFFRHLASIVARGTEVFIQHDNFFQPVGHHDHGLLFLNPQSWKIEPQGVRCWETDRKCDASEEHRRALLATYPNLWSSASKATRNPADCTRCNYFRRSQPWSHLL